MRNINRFLMLIILFLIPVFTALSQATPNTTVYLTNTGRFYHIDGCPSLSHSQIPVSLVDAVRSGFTPCSRCSPPILTGNIAAIPHNYTPLYRVNTMGISNSSEADFAKMLIAEVVGHIDGDTIRVRIPNPPPGLSVLEVIRFLGVDAPETVNPSRPAEHFGQEASDFVRQALLGQTIRLAFDWDLRDRFGRLLAYIYIAKDHNFNALLIYKGYAEAFLRYPILFNTSCIDKLFLQAMSAISSYSNLLFFTPNPLEVFIRTLPNFV